MYRAASPVAITKQGKSFEIPHLVPICRGIAEARKREEDMGRTSVISASDAAVLIR